MKITDALSKTQEYLGSPEPVLAPPKTEVPARRCGTDKPYCWQSRKALYIIRMNVPEAATALAVYVALTVMASENCAETFTATREAIAEYSRLSIRTVASRLIDLETIGLITIRTPRVRGASTFRLLSVNPAAKNE